MGLMKSIESGKEHRKRYKGAKAFDRTCRNHGSCDWCKDNRTFKSNLNKRIAQEKIQEYLKE